MLLVWEGGRLAVRRLFEGFLGKTPEGKERQRRVIYRRERLRRNRSWFLYGCMVAFILFSFSTVCHI